MEKKKIDFAEFLNSINKCYSKNCQDKLPKPKDFPFQLFDHEQNILIEELNSFRQNLTDSYLKSVCYRISAVISIQKARENDKKLDIIETWNLVSKSIEIVPKECVISSIGSQGFLSIPLYKYELEKKNFDFLRLHIWDESLKAYIDEEKCEKFSIHTHSFFAESWPICGKIVNDRYSAKITESPNDHSLFTVQYNKTLNEVNQHTSNAVNSGEDVNLRQISHEIYMPGSHYQINAGNFHKSISKGDNGISATFFSFTAKNGLVDQSFVIGKSEIQSSEINRKMYIDPTPLMNKITKEITSYAG
ncbi:hypothetical protein [Salegentibacter salegens]|uniref:Uncharacterized protein n=1 Tax=Salegentibacter salegens TaxID=143223 RepID=A0A1M7K4Z7_9FLAO|nr:hypothetical protein [Salegentibacter salegens]PRX38890.1 hypothetical protein LY58_03430 [Salegentibacter salegens]SHM60063.1 hypothetical protein SAMN05878281_1240 [Salegentibacter salegens]